MAYDEEMLDELEEARMAAVAAGQPIAADATVGARVTVVYDEESEEWGTVQKPAEGVVTEVSATAMRVRFDADGETLWVSEREGDEWYYLAS